MPSPNADPAKVNETIGRADGRSAVLGNSAVLIDLSAYREKLPPPGFAPIEERLTENIVRYAVPAADRVEEPGDLEPLTEVERAKLASALQGEILQARKSDSTSQVAPAAPAADGDTLVFSPETQAIRNLVARFDSGEEVAIPSELLPTIKRCATYESNDRGNRMRVRDYFGRDLAAREETGKEAGAIYYFDGRYWRSQKGAGQRAIKIMAHLIGPLIKLESRCLSLPPAEEATVAAGKAAAAKKAAIGAGGEAHLQDMESVNTLIEAGEEVENANAKRRAAHWKWGEKSGQEDRVNAMIKGMMPYLPKPAELFDPNPLKFATLTHTFDFFRTLDLECPDPGARRYHVQMIVTPGHNRMDYITRLIPVRYDPEKPATAPKWMAQMAWMLPDPEHRDLLQRWDGLAATAWSVQHVLIMLGEGANGKSVHNQTLFQVIGRDSTVALQQSALEPPRGRNRGAASPEIVQFMGRTAVCVQDMQGELHGPTLKALTGGEDTSVRDLYKSMEPFNCYAKIYITANARLIIRDDSYGLWRRLIIIPFTQEWPKELRRSVPELVAEFLKEERDGIFEQWILPGLVSSLEIDELIIPNSIQQLVAEYRDSSDSVGVFARNWLQKCPVLADPNERAYIQTDVMYAYYVTNALDDGFVPVTAQAFHVAMGDRFARDRVKKKRCYLDVTVKPGLQMAADYLVAKYRDKRGGYTPGTPGPEDDG